MDKFRPIPLKLSKKLIIHLNEKWNEYSYHGNVQFPRAMNMVCSELMDFWINERKITFS